MNEFSDGQSLLLLTVLLNLRVGLRMWRFTYAFFSGLALVGPMGRLSAPIVLGSRLLGWAGRSSLRLARF